MDSENHYVPTYFYSQCDKVIYINSVKWTFSIGNKRKEDNFKNGHLITFPFLEVYVVSCVIEEPVFFLAINNLYRAPDNVVFTNLDEDYAVRFIRKIDGGQL